jgi:ferritin
MTRCDLMEHYLEEQVKSIYEIASFCTQLTRMGKGLGVALLDKQLAP